MTKKIANLFYRWVSQHPKKTIWFYGILTLLCAIPTLIVPIPPFPHLHTKTGTVHLLSDQHHAGRAFKDYIQKFGTPEVLVVVLETPPQHLPNLKPYLEKIAEKLQSKNEWIKSFRYRLPTEFLEERGFYFLSKIEWKQLDQQLRDLNVLVSNLNEYPNLIGLFQYILKEKAQKNIVVHEPNTSPQVTENDISALTQFKQFLQMAVSGEKSEIFQQNDSFRFQEQKRFSFIDSDGFFVVSRQEASYLLLFIEPTNTSNEFEFNQQFVNYVKESIAQVPRPENIPFQIGYTGSPALNVSEMRDSKKDLMSGSILSALLVFILFMGLYHQYPLQPLFALICLGVGILWSFILASIYPGYLNLLSMTFSLLLIGLGVDAGIHFISRFDEELRLKHSTEEALQITLTRLSPALMISTLSTSGAFFTTMFTDFKGFSELGFIAGIGVLICLFLMLTLLPCFLLVSTPKNPSLEIVSPKTPFLLKPLKLISQFCTLIVSFFVMIFQKIAQYIFPPLLKKYHWALVLVTLCLTVFFGYCTSFLEYDKNILNLQSRHSPEVAYMEKILSIGEFGVLLYPSHEEEYLLPEYLDKLRYQGYEPYTFSIQNLVPPHQDIRKKEMDNLPFPFFVKNHKTFTKKELQPILEELLQAFSDIHRALITKEQAGPLRFKLAELIDSGENTEPSIILFLFELEEKLEDPILGPAFLEQLNDFSRHYIEQSQQLFQSLRNLQKASPFTANDLPEAMKNIFISQDGQYRLVQVYPRGDIFDGDTLEEFVEHLRLVSPLATGHPVMVYEMVKSIREGYEDAGWMALIVIFFIVLFLFRSLLNTFLAILSVLIGIIWTFGILALLPNGNLNPANMIALPLILGIGIDNAVHLIHRFREDHQLDQALKHTGRAILTSSITTIFGFVGMSIGHHQGLVSLGNTLILGMLCCVLTCLVVLPCMIAWLQSASPWFNRQYK